MANSNIQFRATAGANPVVEYELFDGLIPSGKISRVISPYASTAVLGNSIQINGVSIPAQMYRFDEILDAGGVPFADVNSANTYLTDLFSNYITGSRGSGGGGGGGDASAANQVIGNDFLENINENLTNFVDFEKTTKDYICIVTGAAATAGQILRKKEFNVVNQATGVNTATIEWYNVSLGTVMATAPLENEYVEYSENKVSRSANSSATALSYRAIENDDINPVPEFSTGDFLIRTTNHNYRFEDGVHIVDSVTTTWFNLATSAMLTTDPPNSYIEFYDGMDYNVSLVIDFLRATNTEAVGFPRWSSGDLLERKLYEIFINGGQPFPTSIFWRNLTTNSNASFTTATITDLTYETVESAIYRELNTVTLAKRTAVSLRKSIANISFTLKKNLSLIEEYLTISSTATIVPYKGLQLLCDDPDQVAAIKTFQNFYYVKGAPMTFEFTTSDFTVTDIGHVNRIGCGTLDTNQPHTTIIDAGILESEWDGAVGRVYFRIYRNGTVLFEQEINQTNFTNGRAIRISYLWLGYAAVQVSVYYNGEWRVVSTYLHEDPATYWANGNMPFIAQCITLNTAVNQNKMSIMCIDVFREDEESGLGVNVPIETPLATNYSNGGTSYLAMAFRLKSGFELAKSTIDSINLLSTSADDFRVRVIRNPTLNNVIAFTPFGDSNVEVYTAPANANVQMTSFNDYNLVMTENSRQLAKETIKQGNLLQLGVSLNGTRDIFAVIITPHSANLTLRCVVNLTDFS